MSSTLLTPDTPPSDARRVKPESHTADNRAGAVVRRLAASYARKSEANEEGIASQHAYNAARALEEGFVIPDERRFRYSDDNASATSGKPRREFERLVADVHQHGGPPFVRVYCKDKSRFGRWADPRMHTYYETGLTLAGAPVRYSVDRGPAIDFTRGDSRVNTGVFLGDQFENARTSAEVVQLNQRVSDRRLELLAEGFYPGGSLAPYATERWLANSRTGQPMERLPFGRSVSQPGCRNRLVWAGDGTRAVVRGIFEAACAGKSLRTIADDLNRRRVPPPDAHRPRRRPRDGREALPSEWTRPAVRRILRQPLYAGHLCWGTARAEDARDYFLCEGTLALRAAVREAAGSTGGACEGASGEDADVADVAAYPDSTPVTPTRVDLTFGDGAPVPLFLNYLPNPPVSTERWLAAQTVLDGRADHDGRLHGRKRSSDAFPLSGLVRCARCARPFHGATKQRARHGGAGAAGCATMEQYVYYRHDRVDYRTAPPCAGPRRYIAAEGLHALAFDAVRAVLRHEAVAVRARAEIERLAREAGGAPQAREASELRAAARGLREQIATLSAAYARATSQTAREAFETETNRAGSEVESVEIRLAALAGAPAQIERARAALERHAAPPDAVSMFDAALPRDQARIAHAVLAGIVVDLVDDVVELRVRAVPSQPAPARGSPNRVQAEAPGSQHQTPEAE